jgi:glycosyltransferase involved in cell wall biosynthesis
MKVSFLVVAHDEVATIGEVLDRIRALELNAQIVVVDDGSTDGTAEAVEQWRAEHGDIIFLRQPHSGKGAAIRRALEYAEGEITSDPGRGHGVRPGRGACRR